MANEMTVSGVEEIVRTAASSLSEALHWYWPATGKNELAEQNVSLHVAGALQRAGFHVFGEYSPDQSTTQRLDVLAISVGMKATVLVEAKRLIKGASVDGMAEDVRRIRAFVPQAGAERWHPGLGDYAAMRRFGVVVATTWDEANAEWFVSGHEYKENPNGLDSLWKAVPNPRKAAWGAAAIQYFKRIEDIGTGKGTIARQWLVYCAFELP